MREILFRGKTVEEPNEWIESCNINTQYDMNGEKHIYIGIHFKFELYSLQINVSWNEVIPETVGQFTGLTDKNGKKIFEGDIVKGLFLHGSAILGVVAFQDGAFGLAWKRGNIDEFSPFPCMCNVDYEVIGNIHDNIELLGE